MKKLIVSSIVLLSLFSIVPQASANMFAWDAPNKEFEAVEWDSGAVIVTPQKLSPDTYINVSLSAGDTQQVVFSDTVTRLSFNATGGQYRYELNSNSADTQSMPVSDFQYIEKTQGEYTQITFFIPYTVSNDVSITLEVERR